MNVLINLMVEIFSQHHTHTHIIMLRTLIFFLVNYMSVKLGGNNKLSCDLRHLDIQFLFNILQHSTSALVPWDLYLCTVNCNRS